MNTSSNEEVKNTKKTDMYVVIKGVHSARTSPTYSTMRP